jgi:uncharacterized repeat protein (TIGR01451 family)
VFSTTTGTDSWQHAWADLTPWAGRRVTLLLRVVEAAGGARAWAYIDEVTVGAALPDTWVSLLGPRSARPGEQAVQTITYGNRASVTARNAQVTLQLPLELTFVSANPPPAAVSPGLRWDAGDLAPGSGPYAISVILQVAQSATTGTVQTTTASITSGTPELDHDNNTAQASVFIGYQVCLPVVQCR